MIRNSIFAENRDPCLVVQFFGGCFFGRERQSGEHTYNGLVGIDRVASQAVRLTKVHAATVARNQDTLWQKKMLENIFGMAAIVSRGNPRENIQRLSIGTLSQCHRILGVKMQFITHPHHQAPRKFRLLGTRFQVDQGHREPTETPRILGLLPGSQLRIPRRRGA